MKTSESAPESRADTEDRLSPFFEAARAAAPEPSDVLVARIAADAAAVSASRSAAVEGGPVTGGATAWQAIADAVRAIGGWPVWSGLAAAGVAGVWIGVADPVGFDPLGVIDSYRIDPEGLATVDPAFDWSSK